MKIMRLLIVSLFLCVQAIAQTPSLSFDPASVSTIPAYGNLKGWFIDAAGYRYVINNNKISKVSPLGQFTVIAGTGIAGFADGPGASAQFSNPVALAADAAGNIYVSDSGNFRVRKITPGGQVSTLAGSGTKGLSDGTGAGASFYALGDITADNAGNVYVIDQQEITAQTVTTTDGKIRKITAAGVVTVFGPGFIKPVSLSADKQGNVWTTKYGGTPNKYSPAGDLLLSIPPEYSAQTITTDKAGNTYVHVWTDRNLNMPGIEDSVFIDKIFPSGRRVRLAGAKPGYKDSTGVNAQFITGLAEMDADDAGNLYVSEEGHTRKMSQPDLHFVAYAGTASLPQHFSVSGNYLTGPATLNAPFGYELSLQETSAYGNSLTISPDAGEIMVLTVYIRLKAGLATGTYNGNVLLGSNGAVNQQLPVSGVATTVSARQGTGLQGVYYNGIHLSGTPLLTRIDSTINFELTDAHQPLSPAPGIVPDDSFSVRWTGQVKALYTETYTFYSISDEGIRLWVNGVKLVDNWVSHGATEKSGTISLVAGQKYNIVIEYFEGTGDAVSKLYWSGAHTAKAIVPQLQLYPPSNETEDLRCFINTTGSLVPDTAAVRPVIRLGTSSPTLAGASVSRNDSRIRYIGGHTVENFDNIQPGNYPKNLFTTAKNISFSSTERSAIGSIAEFDITCPKFEIFEYENGGGVRVLVDNQIAGAYSYRVLGDLNYRLFDFTAINANPVKRHIRLEYSDKSVMGGLKLDTAGVLLPLQDVVNYRICWLGDSFTEGTGVASNQTLHAGLAAYASKILGFRDYRMSGFGGTGYNASFNPVVTPVRPSLADRINYDGINADVFVIAMGINDRETDTALAGKITYTLDNLRAKNPASLIFVLGPYGNGSGSNIKPNVENKIIAAAANRVGVKFISVYDIVFTKSDATHPDAAGHVMLGTAIAARIKARIGAVDTSLQTPVTGNGTGLKGLYLYYDPNLGTLPDTANVFLERTDSTIDFEFTNANLPLVIFPAPDTVLNRGYGVRWTGKIQAQYSELYTFYTLSDDGIRLWINGVLLIDNWMDQAAIEKAKTIPLVAGRQYDIKIEYYQHAGNGVAKLYWSSASTPKAIVPKSQLYPEGVRSNPPPSCSSNFSPADGATLTTTTTAKLIWSAGSQTSPGATTSYDVYIWTGATPPASPTTNVDTNSYTATGLTSSTLYNWYVVPKNASGAAVGCAGSNTTTFITLTVAPCVANILPANNSTLATETTASLSWNSTATATSYDLYIWTASGSAPTTPTRNIAGTTYDTTGLVAGTSYRFYVAPRNASGANTVCAASNTTTFTTAIVLAPCVTNTLPANTAVLPSQTSARLTWPASAGATSYDVYLAAGNTVPTVLRTNTTDITYYATGLTAGTLYSWYIAPRNANGANTACGAANRITFTTAAATGGANRPPVANGGTNITITLPVSTATLNGTASYDPDGSIAEYYWYQVQGPVTASITNFKATPVVAGLTTAGTYIIVLQVKDNNGVPSYSQVTITVNPAVPACVINTSPAAGTTLATQNTVTLTWPASATAASYDVYLAAGAGTPTTLVTNTAALTYSATGLTAGTIYSWYIAPRNASGANTACAASNTTTFTTATAPIVPPACVTNTSPAAGTTLATQTTATLTWPASAGATSYDVYLAAGTGTPTVLVTNTTALTYSATGLTAGTTYSWYIAPRNASGANTACAASNTITFTTATPPAPACVTNTSPAAGTTLATQTTASLTWPSSATATSYDVYLSAGTVTPTVLVTNTADLIYIATDLTAATTYSWYIAPRNASGANTICAASNITTFTTAAPTIPLAACVTNTAPAAGTTLVTQESVMLTWPSSATATSYDVYLAAGAGTPTVLVANTADLTYSATGLTASTTYSWYIAPRNASGANTACRASNTTTFTTATPAVPLAACVTNISPAAGTTLATQDTATLTWPASADATSYDVYLAAGAGTPTVLVTNTADLTYIATGLTAGTTYSWYIAPRNASGANTTCATSNTTTFTTAAPTVTFAACVTNTSPAAGTTLATQDTATLTWPASADATSYDVYLAAGAGTPTVLVTNTADLTYIATGLTAGTTYSWYIAPRNASGANTTCATSNTTTFTTAAPTVTFAACVSNTSPAAGITIATQNTASLIWPSSATATSYDVYLAAGAGTPTVLVTNTADLTYIATGLTAGTTYSWYIAPRNEGGANTGCAASNTTTFITAIPPVPACVTNTSPAAGITIATQNTASLTWPSSATATSYDVYLAAGAGTPTVLVTNTAALTYIATGLTAGTTYSWYVAPGNASGANTACATSNATTFTTAAAIVLAPCVTNTLPANTAVLPSQTSARITWPASAGATSYDVYLAAGNAVPTMLRTNTTDLTYYATGLTAGTLYSWYIAPRNANGANTACGATNRTTFTTAAATGGANRPPVANGGTNITITLPVSTATLNGTASYDPDGSIAEYYWYQVQGPVTTSVTNFKATPVVTGLTAAGTYIIVLQVKDNNGVPSYSQVTITVSPAGTPAVPACVTNTSPAAGTTLAMQNTVTLTWPSSATATSYDVYLAAGAGTPTTLVTNTTALTYTSNSLNAGTIYSWYIAPRNASGANTACAASNTTTFTTATAPIVPPACVTNTSPAAGTTLATQTTATLTWPASAGATSYDVYLAAGTGTPTTLVTNTTALTYTSNSLNAGATYSWYIAPRNASGANTACAASNTITFTTATPPAPACIINTSPVAGATLATQTTVTLTWPASSGATSYDLYLAAGTGTPTTLVTNTAALMYSATGLIPGTTYRWYIAPGNAGGANTACAASNTTAFITATPSVPTCASSPVPANGTVIGTSATAALSWGTVLTATSYDVFVWPTSGSAPASATSNVTANAYTATGLSSAVSYSWYVVPKNASGPAAGCAASNTTTFTTAAAPAFPACVTNTLPANTAVLPSQTSARLTWPASAGAISYDVYLAAGNTVPTVLRTNTTDLTYYATGLTAGTLYSWYIAPRNANGANTACGATNRTTFTTAAATGGANRPPVANGGTNITITLPVSTATLNGTASYDPDGSIAEYYWYQAQGPVTTSITNFKVTPVVTGLTTAGTYVFGLQVKDNNGVPSYSSVTVTVRPAGAPLVAGAGSNLRTETTDPVSVVPSLTSTLSPNPVKPGHYARVQINSNRTGTAVIKLMSSTGTSISYQRINVVKGINITSISTAPLAQGLYLISITGGDKPMTLKLIID